MRVQVHVRQSLHARGVQGWKLISARVDAKGSPTHLDLDLDCFIGTLPVNLRLPVALLPVAHSELRRSPRAVCRRRPLLRSPRRRRVPLPRGALALARAAHGRTGEGVRICLWRRAVFFMRETFDEKDQVVKVRKILISHRFMFN